jgi:hypothetical protein
MYKVLIKYQFIHKIQSNANHSTDLYLLINFVLKQYFTIKSTLQWLCIYALQIHIHLNSHLFIWQILISNCAGFELREVIRNASLA